MKQPEILAVSLPLNKAPDTKSILESRPLILHLRLTLKSQLHSQGWQDVPLEDIQGMLYCLSDGVHLVAAHRPTGLAGVLTGGMNDGAVIDIGRVPPLTLGIIAGNDPCDTNRCDCYDDEDFIDEPEQWFGYVRRGLVHEDDTWRWAYIEQSNIERDEQLLHDRGSDHRSENCTVCKLERFHRNAHELPPRLRADDVALHHSRAPHAVTYCSACRAGYEGASR